MELILYILGMFYILSFAITLAFGIEQSIQAKLKWYHYIFTVFLAATWPLIGFWLANKMHKESRGTIKFWRDKYYEVISNEISKEVTESNEERTEDSQ